MTKRSVVYLIPNFHYDVTWHKDLATFMAIASDILLEALDLLDQDPAYRFVVDHAAFLQGFVRAHPEQVERLRQHTLSGRLELVGGMFSMMDCDIPEGEAFVRQLLYGQRWLERTIGKRSSVGWFLDVYGFNPQLPQLLRQAGMEQLELCLWWAPEYMAKSIRHSEFWWEGLDGTRVLTHVAYPDYSGPRLPGARSYNEPAAGFGADEDEEKTQALKAIGDYVSKAQEWATGSELMVHIGGDFAHPLPGLSKQVAWWNEQPEGPQARVAVPSEFFAAVRRRANGLPVVRGEISPKMRTIVKTVATVRELAAQPMLRNTEFGRFGEGYGETKVERKQLDRLFGARIRTAEKFSVLASLLGWRHSQPEIERLYQPVMVYQHHDPFIGCCVADEYNRMLDLLHNSLGTAQALTEDALRFIGGWVDSRGEGRPVLVANPLAWQRTDVASVKLVFEPREAYGIVVQLEDGTEIPSQIIDRSEYDDGSIREAEVLFCTEVPPLGYRVVYVRAAAPSATDRGRSQTGGLTLENARYRLALSPAGTICSLQDVATGRTIVGPGAGEIILEEDLGCFCYIDATGRVWRQEDYPYAQVYVSETGPVRWRVVVRNELPGVSYLEEISIYEAVKRVEFDLQMEIRSGENLRARVRFPLPRQCQRFWCETPYGAVERGEELAHAINWVDCTMDGAGLALLNEGIPSHELSHNELYLTLWRGLSMFNDCEGCLRREQRAPLIERGVRRFRYALYPHTGDWRQAGVVHAGYELNNPLIALPIGVHGGALPLLHSWFQVWPMDVILDVVKKREEGEGLVLRLYESSGRHTEARLHLPAGFRRWGEANLLEETTQAFDLSGQELKLNFRPFEIKTIILIP